MYPELFQFTLGQNNITVSSYMFFGLLAFGYMLFAALFYLIRYYKVTLPKALGLIILVAFSFFVGARLLYVFLYFSRVIDDPGIIVDLELRNFTLYGGLFLALFSWWFLTRVSGLFLEGYSLAARLLPHVGIAVFIMRFGCLLNGCCYGKVTDIPWGINMPHLSPAHLTQIHTGSSKNFFTVAAVHPTQVYEMIAALLASAIAWTLLKKGEEVRKNLDYKAWNMVVIASFGLVFSLGRLITFFYREFATASEISNFVRGPIIYGLVSVVCMILLVRIKEYK